MLAETRKTSGVILLSSLGFFHFKFWQYDSLSRRSLDFLLWSSRYKCLLFGFFYVFSHKCNMNFAIKSSGTSMIRVFFFLCSVVSWPQVSDLGCFVTILVTESYHSTRQVLRYFFSMGKGGGVKLVSNWFGKKTTKKWVFSWLWTCYFGIIYLNCNCLKIKLSYIQEWHGDMDMEPMKRFFIPLIFIFIV